MSEESKDGPKVLQLVPGGNLQRDLAALKQNAYKAVVNQIPAEEEAKYRALEKRRWLCYKVETLLPTVVGSLLTSGDYKGAEPVAFANDAIILAKAIVERLQEEFKDVA